MIQDSLLGAVVDGRYVITRRIARGGMATVYRARDKRLERDVAIKLMHPHLAEHPDFTERFNREARAAARLSSAYVVTVHDQGVWDSGQGRHAYLVMEYVPGPDVRSELTRMGSFNLGTALAITEQTLRALSAAHSAGIVHRDVKPENIMLASRLPPLSIFERPDVHAKVADFGLARAATSASTAASQVMGTVAYLAPEVITSGVTEAPADVYAVGIMLYEFLTGSLPFQADTPIATAYKHINETMPRAGEHADWLPPALDSYIGLLTAKDAAARPANGEDALRELLAITRAIPEEDLLRRIPVIPEPAEPQAQSSEEATSPTVVDLAPAPLNATIPVPPAEPHDVDAPGGSEAFRGGSASSGRKRLPARPPKPTGRHETAVLSRRRAPSARMLASATAALLVLFLVGGAWFFLAGPGRRVAVPNVSGKTYEQAVKALDHKGLKADRKEAYSDTVPSGKVVSTDPEAGEETHPDDPVTVTVSLGVEQVEVPDLSGLTSSQAERKLSSAGLAYRETEEYSADVAKGHVVSQSVEAGSSIDRGTQVTVTVSKGREPVSVPDVVSMTESEATSELEELGLVVSSAGAHSESVPKGKVISQNPTKGRLYKGDTISITVSLGPELYTVPNVVGMQRAQAEQTLRDSGFEPEVSDLWGGYFGTVRFQDPGADSKAPKGSKVKIRVV